MKILCALGVHRWSHYYDLGLFMARQAQPERYGVLFYEDMRVVCGKCGSERSVENPPRSIPEVMPCS